MSWSDEWFEREFGSTRVLVILRGHGVEGSLARAERAWAAGVRLVEVPLQRADDVAALAAVAAAAAEHGLAVGAGTIVHTEQIAVAQRAGATFTVSPGTDADVIRASLAAGLPPLPGVATATDIHVCQRAGLNWLKMFPAASLGPDWITALHGPFPAARFVATGGLTVANAEDFLRTGARGVSLGSGFDSADPAELTRLVGAPGVEVRRALP